jgi:hypothetical protein
MLAFKGFFICAFVHRNAEMTEDLQSKFEVVSASADNPISFQGDNSNEYKNIKNP